MRPCNVYCTPHIPKRRIEDITFERKCKKTPEPKKVIIEEAVSSFTNYAWIALAVAVALLLFNKRFKNSNFNNNRNGR